MPLWWSLIKIPIVLGSENFRVGEHIHVPGAQQPNPPADHRLLCSRGAQCILYPSPYATSRHSGHSKEDTGIPCWPAIWWVTKRMPSPQRWGDAVQRRSFPQLWPWKGVPECRQWLLPCEKNQATSLDAPPAILRKSSLVCFVRLSVLGPHVMSVPV